MKLKKILKSENPNNELEFNLYDNSDYLSLGREIGEYYSLFSYKSNKKQLVIDVIRKGYIKPISNIFKKTLEIAILEFDINEIYFKSLKEERTKRILFDSKLQKGQILKIPNFENSPFLRESNNFGYSNFKTNAYTNLLSELDYYLICLKK